MCIKTHTIPEKRRLLPHLTKLVLALMVVAGLIGSATAASDINGTDPNILPALPLDPILSELYTMGSGWLKWVVLIVVVFGGICYAASKSEESRATGATYMKNAIIAVVGVMVVSGIINRLYAM